MKKKALKWKVIKTKDFGGQILGKAATTAKFNTLLYNLGFSK